MKVLMLGWELPPHNSGGLGVACYQLCKALSKKGVDIEFVLPYTAQHDIDFMRINAAHPQDVDQVLKAGIAYDSFKYVKNTGEIHDVDIFGQSAIYEKAIERIVQLAEFDVIHAHDWLTCRAALRAKELTGKPLIVHIHSIESDRSGKKFKGNPIVREIEETALLLADSIIAVSELTKQSIHREYGIPLDKISVVHNSFDTELMIPNVGTNAYSYLTAMKQQGYKVVGSIGRLTIQKGLTNLLRAFKHVQEKAPKTFLLIVGAGDQYQELIMLAAELGISKNVVFADFQRGKGYRDAFSVSDLFVMPSVSEPFGIAPLESTLYGTPALISKQSGVSEVISNFLKVDFWDEKEMANQIYAAITYDSLRAELQNNAYKEFERLSWNTAASKVFETYQAHSLDLVEA